MIMVLLLKFVNFSSEMAYKSNHRFDSLINRKLFIIGKKENRSELLVYMLRYFRLFLIVNAFLLVF